MDHAYPGLGVGSLINVRIGGERLGLPIIGVMKEFGGASIYMDEAGFKALYPLDDDLVNLLYLTLKEPTGENLNIMKVLLEQHFEMAGVKVTNSTVLTARQGEKQ